MVLAHDRRLVFKAMARVVSGVHRNGGVVPAGYESRRLSRTYPEAALSESDIFRCFDRLACRHRVLLEGRPYRTDSPTTTSTSNPRPSPR